MTTATYKDCIVAILGNGEGILIKESSNVVLRLTGIDKLLRDETSNEIIEKTITLNEILDLDNNNNLGVVSSNMEEQEKVYVCDIVLRSWQDNTPNSCDWNLEFDLENKRELIIPV